MLERVQQARCLGKLSSQMLLLRIKTKIGTSKVASNRMKQKSLDYGLESLRYLTSVAYLVLGYEKS